MLEMLDIQEKALSLSDFMPQLIAKVISDLAYLKVRHGTGNGSFTFQCRKIHAKFNGMTILLFSWKCDEIDILFA